MSGYDMPLFGNPDKVEEKRVLSKREEGDALRPRWTRYSSPGLVCAMTHPTDPRQRCRPVTWMRVIGTENTLLCAEHRQDIIDRIALDAPRGSQ